MRKIVVLENSVEYYVDEIKLAEVNFPEIHPNLVEMNHTYVDPSLQGQGIAGMLMEYAYLAIKLSGRRVQLTCSYASGWYGRHPEKRDIIE